MPSAAIVGVLAVCLVTSLYAAVVADVVRDRPDADRSRVAFEAVREQLVTVGVAWPRKLDHAASAAPAGHHVLVRLSYDGSVRRAGESGPPPSAGSTTERVGVRRDPTDVVPGTLTVVSWT